MLSYPLHSTKFGFLGAGHMAQNIIKGYLQYSPISKNNIFISGRNLKKTQRIAEKWQVQMTPDNETLLEKASVIFICVKPQDMEEALQNLKIHWQSHHTVFSLAAGVSFKTLKKWGLSNRRLLRLMPNMGVCVGKGFLPFCSLNKQESLHSFVEELLKPLGQVMILENESLLSSVTVAGSSGLAFVFELMQYWTEWLEGEGYSYKEARTISLQVFMGAGFTGFGNPNKSFPELQKEITSPKGITHKGLKTMRELDLERILRLSFEEAHLKVKDWEKKKNFQ